MFSFQTDYKALKTSYNQLKLQQTDLKGKLHEAKEQVASMDVEHSKALNRCEVLAQMNNSLEDDRRSLMSQVGVTNLMDLGWSFPLWLFFAANHLMFQRRTCSPLSRCRSC